MALVSFPDAGLIFEGTMTRTDNHVAPVIIRNCMEEYQHVSDFTEPFVYDSIADKMPEHLLIQVMNSYLKSAIHQWLT